MADLPLAAEFPQATHDDWLALAGDLDRLRSTTHDGISIEPLYTAADAISDGWPGLPGFAPFVRGRTAAGHRDGWDVRQPVDVGQGRGAAVAELERGATSVWLRLRDAAVIDEHLLDSLLDGVLLDVAPVVLDAGPRWPAAATALTRVWAQRRVDPAAVTGSFGADPLGEWSTHRGAEVDDELRLLADEARFLAADHPGVRVATIDGNRYHDRGASDGQELAWTLAAAVATLRGLADAGLDVAAALPRFELRLAATVDQFATIAKFRAARRLWARVAEACDVPAAARAVPLHAVTSQAMATRYDAATNMLRHTVACFAAGVAGADAVTVFAHDALRGASDLGRRIARNTQTVLALESNLARVIDPAGGAWYVERRTEQLAERAWDEFQEIEVAGGFRAAVEAGIVDDRIAATRAKRAAAIAHRRTQIVGVTAYPDSAERLAHDGPAVGGDDRVHRWAEPFESLRWLVDAAEASGRAPTVFLATLGSPPSRPPRFAAAENFFGIVGIETVRGPVTDDRGEVIESFRESGTSIACICPRLEDLVEPEGLREALTAAGATRVYSALALGGDAVVRFADLVEHLELP